MDGKKGKGGGKDENVPGCIPLPYLGGKRKGMLVERVVVVD